MLVLSSVAFKGGDDDIVLGPSMEPASTKRAWVDAIGGGRITFQGYDPGGGRAPRPNWIFECPRHRGCRKSKGYGDPMLNDLGGLGPVAWLHCWRDVACDPDEQPAHTGRKG